MDPEPFDPPPSGLSLNDQPYLFIVRIHKLEQSYWNNSINFSSKAGAQVLPKQLNRRLYRNVSKSATEAQLLRLDRSNVTAAT